MPFWVSLALTQLEWPPSIQSAEDYAAELSKAIDEFPPFAEFVQRRYNWVLDSLVASEDEDPVSSVRSAWVLRSKLATFETVAELKRAYVNEVTEKALAEASMQATVNNWLRANRRECEDAEDEVDRADEERQLLGLGGLHDSDVASLRGPRFVAAYCRKLKGLGWGNSLV